MPEFLSETPSDGPALAQLLLAHGAGAPMTSPFLAKMSKLLTERRIGVSRFEFAYMAARREGGKRRPPPRAESLVGEYEMAVAELSSGLAGEPLLIGGKSMGGRVASLAADTLYGVHRIAGPDEADRRRQP